ncbi:MAG: hypothetical protein DRJ07_16175, partial [Bacteroidetes bacterium]
MTHKVKLIFFIIFLNSFFSYQVSAQDKEINLVKGLPKARIEKTNLGKSINSVYSEYVPVISPDGRTLYVFVHGDPNNIGEGDIWYSKKLGKLDRENRKNIGSTLNNEASNFVISVSPDNNTLFLSRRYKKKGGVVLDNGRGFSLTHRIKGGWSIP